MPSLAVTVDIEDWYHIPSVTGSPFSVYKDTEEFFQKWSSRYDYLSKPTNRVLDILDEYNIEATFFIVAEIVNHYPGLVESIVERGHEIACHGLNHACKIDPKTKVPLMNIEEFRERTGNAKKILEQVSGQSVVGYRAPNALVGRWMLEELPNIGFIYDSSVNMNSLYNKSDINSNGITSKPYEFISGLIEFPMTYWELLGVKIPASGGPILRFLGKRVILNGIIQSLERGESVFYFHPLDISMEKFPSVGNKRPLYWVVKGKIVENRLKYIFDELRKRDIIIFARK